MTNPTNDRTTKTGAVRTPSGAAARTGVLSVRGSFTAQASPFCSINNLPHDAEARRARPLKSRTDRRFA